MPVIYLPQDTRYSDLAKGLGQLIGQAFTGYMAQKQNTDIASIQGNPNLTQDQKTQAVQSKYGDDGVKSLINMMRLDQLRAQTRTENAQAGHLEAGTGLENVETQSKQALLPGLAAQQAADTAAAQAKAQYTTAETQQVIPAQVGETQARTTYLQGPQTTSSIATTGKTTEETNLIKVQEHIAQQQSDAYANLTKNPGTMKESLDQMGITDPQDQAQVQAALVGGGSPQKGMENAQKVIDQILQTKRAAATKAGEPKMVPEDIRKNVTQAASQANTLEEFLNPPAPGTPSGFSAGIQAWFSKRGFTNPDPDLLQRATAADQATAQYASSGGGFGGSWRVKLAEGVVPQVQHSPIGNVIDVGTIANDKLKELQSQKDQLIPGMDSKAIDDQIKRYQAINNRAQSLWWTSPTDSKGQAIGDGKVHFYYGRDEVDKDLRVVRKDALLPDSNTYRNAQGQTIKGSELNKAARLVGMDPQMFAKLKGFQ